MSIAVKFKKRIYALSPENIALYDAFRNDIDDAAIRHIGQSLPLPAYYAHYLPPLEKALKNILSTLPDEGTAKFIHAYDESGNRVIQIEALIPEKVKS